MINMSPKHTKHQVSGKAAKQYDIMYDIYNNKLMTKLIKEYSAYICTVPYRPGQLVNVYVKKRHVVLKFNIVYNIDPRRWIG